MAAPPKRRSRSKSVFWESWPTWAKNLALVGAGVTAALALLGLIGSFADSIAKFRQSGPMPYAARSEVETLEEIMEKTRAEIDKSIAETYSNLQSLDARQQATTAELERRNIRGLQTSLETAKLKARQSRSIADEMIVETLEAQLARALDEFQNDQAKK